MLQYPARQLEPHLCPPSRGWRHRRNLATARADQTANTQKAKAAIDPQCPAIQKGKCGIRKSTPIITNRDLDPIFANWPDSNIQPAPLGLGVFQRIVDQVAQDDLDRDVIGLQAHPLYVHNMQTRRIQRHQNILAQGLYVKVTAVTTRIRGRRLRQYIRHQFQRAGADLFNHPDHLKLAITHIDKILTQQVRQRFDIGNGAAQVMRGKAHEVFHLDCSGGGHSLHLRQGMLLRNILRNADHIGQRTRLIENGLQPRPNPKRILTNGDRNLVGCRLALVPGQHLPIPNRLRRPPEKQVICRPPDHIVQVAPKIFQPTGVHKRIDDTARTILDQNKDRLGHKVVNRKIRQPHATSSSLRRKLHACPYQRLNLSWPASAAPGSHQTAQRSAAPARHPRAGPR
mmetsp:Transcript_432/g.1260  ORF Transcript_432/g.1260 Transcript_432/m.1260 type:complete len:399 (-) Transcript_432:547-1743(-)